MKLIRIISFKLLAVVESHLRFAYKVDAVVSKNEHSFYALFRQDLRKFCVSNSNSVRTVSKSVFCVCNELLLVALAFRVSKQPNCAYSWTVGPNRSKPI